MAEVGSAQHSSGRDLTAFEAHALNRWLPAGLYAFAIASLLYPAIANRFPLVMGDTWRYLAEADGSYSWVSSQYFGYFLRLFDGTSLWIVVLVQALLVLFVIDAFLRRVCDATPIQSAILVMATALTTPVGLFASLVMTDFLFGVGLVAATVLIVGRRSRPGDIALALIVAFSAAAHPAAFPLLAVVLVGLVVGGLAAFRSRLRRGIGRLGLLAGAMVVALAALGVNNAILWGSASPNPHSSIVAFAYLLSHGDLEDELAGCATWVVCTVEERPAPGIVGFNRFLFSQESVLWTDLGGTAFAPEATEIVVTHVMSDPFSYARRVMSSAITQLFLVRADDHVEWMEARLGERHSRLLAEYSRSDVGRFESGEQFRKRLDLGAESDLGVATGWLGAAAAIGGAFVWALGRARGRRWTPPLRSGPPGALLLVGLYILHSIVVGTSTYPAPRYGGRVLWLLGLAFWGWLGMGVQVLARSHRGGSAQEEHRGLAEAVERSGLRTSSPDGDVRGEGVCDG